MIEWAEEAKTRQGLYRFVGVALRTPSRENLELLVAASAFLNRVDIDRFAYSIEWRRFCEELVHLPELDELVVEHVRLFGVGMGGTPAMPTESYYRVPDKDGGIAAFVSALQHEYRAMGLVSVGTAENPDHISTEMEVMSYLCSVEADAWESSQYQLAIETLGVESGFLKRHLAIWVPVFAECVRDAGASAFYMRLIDLLHAYIVYENDYVHGVVERSTQT